MSNYNINSIKQHISGINEKNSKEECHLTGTDQASCVGYLSLHSKLLPKFVA